MKTKQSLAPFFVYLLKNAIIKKTIKNDKY